MIFDTKISDTDFSVVEDFRCWTCLMLVLPMLDFCYSDDFRRRDSDTKDFGYQFIRYRFPTVAWMDGWMDVWMYVWIFLFV